MAKSVGFVEANKLAFQKITDYNGRASRSEYWWFILGALIISFILGIIVGIPVLGGIVAFVVGIILLLAWIALMVRRLHDIKLSGWWILIGLIPGIGELVLIVFALMPSK